MKILVAGDFKFFWYEESCARAFENLGHEVVREPRTPYFVSVIGRAERKWTFSGPGTWLTNLRLIHKARLHQPDVILIWFGNCIWPWTIRRLRSETTACLVSYHNDDPFGPSCHWRLWRLFHRGISEYDLNVNVRAINADDYYTKGARQFYVLPEYFIPELHRPTSLTPPEKKKYECDVVFVGHFEPDGRLECLRALVNAGVHVRLFGTGWTQEVLGDLSGYFGKVYPVYRDEYVKALCGAKICLAFLSKLNRDPYTIRSFEIPACGRPMVSEYSLELTIFYNPDKEAMYFRSPGELLIKIRMLMADENLRQEIADAGYNRCISDRHDVTNRMRDLLTEIERIGRL